ncbi:MAG TPA: hypothetical protein VLJ11_11455, partial [Bryobacteraceae bacterium]|nr:hypothetical protein [Bryobacteraceae bacterium]
MESQDGPGFGGAVAAPGSTGKPRQASASITGTVQDLHGAVIPGIVVTLVGQSNTVRRVATADR